MKNAKSPVLDLTEEQFKETFGRISYVVDEFRKIFFDETVTDPFMKMKQLYAVIDVLPRSEERLVATRILINLFIEYAMATHETTVMVSPHEGEVVSGASGSDEDKQKLN